MLAQELVRTDSVLAYGHRVSRRASSVLAYSECDLPCGRVLAQDIQLDGQGKT